MWLQFAMLEIHVPHSVFEDEVSNQTLPGVSVLSGEGIDAPVYANYFQSRLPAPIVVPSSVVTIVYNRSSSLSMEPGRFILDYSVLNTGRGIWNRTAPNHLTVGKIAEMGQQYLK